LICIREHIVKLNWIAEVLLDNGIKVDPRSRVDKSDVLNVIVEVVDQTVHGQEVLASVHEGKVTAPGLEEMISLVDI
jgi:hypothetical protein